MIQRRVNHIQNQIKVLAVIIMNLVCLSSCSLEDSRDLCCDTGNVMRYTYRPHGLEEFNQNIHTMRHFLFDKSGYFVRELNPGEDLQYQPLDLSEGEYMMVSIGNMKDKNTVVPSEPADSHIRDIRIETSRICDSEKLSYANSDEIFWGISRFDVDCRGNISDHDDYKRYSDYTFPVTEMNNIHCHLNVKVEWANMPRFYGDYEMELIGVPMSYPLDPTLAYLAGGFTVPVGESVAYHRLSVPLEGYELYGEFVTLRFSNENIPTLCILYKNTLVGPDIDLKRAFSTWGWRPSEIHEQEYSILVRLFADDRAEVMPLFKGEVSDWINGGVFN